MSADLQGAMRATRAGVDARLAALLCGGPPRLLEAMRYAVLGPGKRLRPILCIWTHELLQGRQAAAALDTACALEFVHTYSLVHDDLPCMDDDELRRGRPTCHVQFGEALAVLVGDALLDLAFDVLLGAGWDEPDTALRVARVLAGAASHRGLVGGQALDLEAAGAAPTAERLAAIHAAKTGALLQASLLCGAHAAGAQAADIETLRQVGIELGLAFQIADDVLDVVGDAASLGKSPGKDVALHKMTYPALYGVERSRSLADEHAARARALLGRWPGSENLQALASYLVQRRS